MNNTLFKELAEELDINITEKMLEQFDMYYKFLVEYNKKVNLTAITEKEEVYLKHFLDSILFINNIKKEATLCDVGTGAGFPSIPLKIVRPDIKLTLVDSLNKRVVFLKELVNKLVLTNVEVVHSRAEDFAKNNRENFDYVTARAVASLNTLAEYCVPLVKIDGFFIPYKSGNIEEELNNAKTAIKKLGAKTINVFEKVLPGTEIKRSVIEIKKLEKTDLLYPRGGNKPKKQPL